MKRLLTVLAMLFVFALPAAVSADSEVSTPNISVTTSTGSATFTLKSDSDDVRIYYTTNGKDPTTSSARYSSRVTVKSTCEVRAVAYDPDEREYSDVGYYLVSVTQDRVATPTFTATSVTGGKKVTIKSSTSGATIYYTTDGSTPTTSSRRYSSGITVTEDTVIKAIAVKSGYANSSVATATCIIDELASPTATRTTTSNGYKITLKGPSGATIYYTTNGSTPTTSSKRYSSPFTVTSDCTIKAKAVRSGYSDSDVVSFDIEVPDPKCAEPEATKTATTGGYLIKLSCDTSGATIYYTTDGTDPSRSSSRYSSSGIKVTAEDTTYIRAIAVRSGYEDSDIVEFEIDVDQLSKPTATKTTLSNGYKITLKASSGAAIYYTTDGSTPNTSDRKYSSPFTVTSSCTVKAIAVRSGYASSEVLVFDIEVDDPQVADIEGTKTAIAGGYLVKLSTDTSGATIYYTTDGSTPNTSDRRYTSSGIKVTEQGSTRIRAIAVKSGYEDSDVFSARITVSKLATPEAKAATTSSGVRITLSGPSGATIYYTTNGSTPTTSSKKYTSPFTVSSDCTLKAIAVKNGYANSSIIAGTINVSSTRQVANPTATKKDYSSYSLVTLKCSTSGARIYYTTDGSDPLENGKGISSGSSIRVYESCIIRAVATRSGYEDSSVVRFTINVKGDNVTILGLDDDATTTDSADTEIEVIGEEEESTSEALVMEETVNEDGLVNETEDLDGEEALLDEEDSTEDDGYNTDYGFDVILDFEEV